MEKTKITDKSGDKKYFTQIPNIIANHSSAYEQSLYLIMKRLAGESGYCYASLNFLASKMGVHKTTVSKTIDKLLKRSWITETEKKKVRGGLVRTFTIVDIWKLNIDNYESGAETTTKESGAVADGSGAVVNESGSQTDTKNIYKEEKKEDMALAIQRIAYKKEIDFLIDLFKDVNPTYERLFGNTTQRASLERLVKKFGREQIESMIRFLPKIFGKLYAPRISTPYQLEQKLADLMAYIQQERSKKPLITKIS